MSKKSFYVFFFLALTFLPVFVVAQEERSYQYDSIEVQIKVNKDSTFDISENQLYNYRGEYHQGWRSIPLNKISAITNIQIIDGATGQTLKYNPNKLDKYNSASWGYYTTYKENGSQIVEWYYNLKDTAHLWIIRYKVHGGLGFYKDHDEVYWNLFTDYSVPVYLASARVVLPKNNFTVNQESAWLYWAYDSRDPSHSTSTPPSVIKERGGNYIFNFPTTFDTNGKATISAGWPKGLIEQKAFWWDWFFLNWPYILSLLIILVSIIYYTIYWYLTERWHQGRGTIIPQYEPPKNLPPAMAELVAKEKITKYTWPATVIDLAVRGYVKITEKRSLFLAIGNKLVLFVFGGLGSICLLGFCFYFWRDHNFNQFPLLIFVFILGLICFSVYKRGNNDFVVTRQKDFDDDPELRDFEKDFLRALLRDKGEFSTDQNRFNPTAGRKLYEKMKEVEKRLYSETDFDTQAYEIGLKNKKIFDFLKVSPFLLIYGGLFSLFIFSQLKILFALPVATGGLCWLIIYFLKKYNPRLNKNGQILKEEWLGFRMYLEKAEKYRLQNLTPDLFEKYLPYAMIFGVEKKWAKNFDDLNIQPPAWYVSSTTGAGFASSSVGGSGFSASAFSSSFSSSFSSAFSSSGGGGSAGGGGGGGAGGGGGGGGGGAS